MIFNYKYSGSEHVLQLVVLCGGDHPEGGGTHLKMYVWMCVDGPAALYRSSAQQLTFFAFSFFNSRFAPALRAIPLVFVLEMVSCTKHPGERGRWNKFTHHEIFTNFQKEFVTGHDNVFEIYIEV